MSYFISPKQPEDFSASVKKVHFKHTKALYEERKENKSVVQRKCIKMSFRIPQKGNLASQNPDKNL